MNQLKRRMRVAQFSLAMGALASFAGCASAGCPKNAVVNANDLWAFQERRENEITSLKTEARVEQWESKGRIVGTVLMFLQSPDRVRFDVMTQLGPAAVLTSDGEKFELLDHREGRFLSGPTCAENIERLLGVRLNSTDVFRLLTGQLPELEGSEQSVECSKGLQWVTRTVNGNQEQRTAFKRVGDVSEGEQTYRVSKSSLHDADGKKLWTIHFSDYKRVKGGEAALPWLIRFVDKANGNDTTIRVKSAAVGVEVPSDAFSQAIPAGMPNETAICR